MPYLNESEDATSGTPAPPPPPPLPCPAPAPKVPPRDNWFPSAYPGRVYGDPDPDGYTRDPDEHDRPFEDDDGCLHNGPWGEK